MPQYCIRFMQIMTNTCFACAHIGVGSAFVWTKVMCFSVGGCRSASKYEWSSDLNGLSAEHLKPEQFSYVFPSQGFLLGCQCGAPFQIFLLSPWYKQDTLLSGHIWVAEDDGHERRKWKDMCYIFLWVPCQRTPVKACRGSFPHSPGFHLVGSKSWPH